MKFEYVIKIIYRLFIIGNGGSNFHSSFTGEQNDLEYITAYENKLLKYILYYINCN